jgi:antagonist of KipI
VLEVIEPGLLTTVQDAGRPEAVELGVPVGGACDPWSLGLANALLGNEPAAAGLEMTLAGATLRAMDDCLIAIAGADFGATIVDTGRRLEPASREVLRRGQTLAFGAADGLSGIRAYVAVAGGVDVPVVLGSRSTCLIGGFGGLDGRALRAGDRIRAQDPARRLAPSATRDPAFRAPRASSLRVVRGPHASLLGSAWQQLLGHEYSVSARSDRQGIRLDGPALRSAEEPPSILSHGVTWGAIQVPPEGQPICLLADHQTVGGYPVLAVVIGADRASLGQLGPADPVRFSEVTIDEAQQSARRHADEFRTLAGRLGSS